jgi:DNA-binding Xre family transcriptional regulator
MNINDMLEQKNMSKYQLSKKSGVPYTTVHDICNGKVPIPNCSTATIFKISKALDISMDLLVADAMEQRPNFETFKGNVCHMVKEMGDLDFLVFIVQSNDIRRFFEKRWYPESLYLLAMVDYLCRENNLPLCSAYDDLRHARLNTPLYPAGIHMMCATLGKDTPKKDSWDTAIPEFRQFNIVENEVRNVV